MINTRDYFGRPLYLSGTPSPYQGFAPIGEYQRRQKQSPTGKLQEILAQSGANPLGQGQGTGPGTGPGTGTTGTAPTGTNDTGAAPPGTLPPVFPTTAPVVPGGQPAQGGPSAMDIALGTYRYGQRPDTPTDNPYGYPDWEAARRAYEWEVANGRDGTSHSPDNPHQPDYERYPGSSGDQPGGSGTSGGSSSGGSSGGGGGDPPPQFGIGGAIGGYPGVYTPEAPRQDDPSLWELVNGAWKLKDIFGGAGAASDVVQDFVAGPGSAPPTGGFGDVSGQVGDAVGAINLGKTLLDGDVDTFDKIAAGVGYVFPPLAALNLGLQALGVGGESSTSKARRGYQTWGAVNDAFLDALGRDEGPSRNIGYWHPNLKASNVDDLNFLNSFLQSKDLLWGEDTQPTSKDNLLRAGGVKGGELIDMYGNDIERLWSDLTGYYGTYSNAPAPGDVASWGESAQSEFDKYLASLSDPRTAFSMTGGQDTLAPSSATQDWLAQYRGDPSDNPLYNVELLGDDWLTNQMYAYAYGKDDPYGFNAPWMGAESGAWSYGW